jgi:hypothetical protein
VADPVVAIIGEQRKRLIGAVLGHAEREMYPDLTEEQQRAFRAKVLQSAGAFSDFVIDVVRGVSQGVYLNEEAMRLLADINAQVRNINMSLED